MPSEIDGSIHIMKRIELTDARSGRVLCFALHPIEGAVRIDQDFVERKPALESSEEELVFGPPHTDESDLVYLLRSQVNRARQMWGMPEL